MALGVTSYHVVLALHVMAVVVAYGLPLSAPVLLPYLRRAHPRALPGFHDVQHRLNVRVTGPGTLLLLAFGVYMASERDLWDRGWVQFGLAAIAVIAVLGAWIVRALGRLAELARAGVEAAPAGGPVSFDAEYEALYARYLRAETFLGLRVLATIFVMAAKPFS